MASFGEELRRERELRGIKLSDISGATRVNAKFLEALEENRFEEVPGGVFTRGIIKAYARHLGIDEEELLNAYALEAGKRKGAGSSRPAGTPPARKWWEKLFSGRK